MESALSTLAKEAILTKKGTLLGRWTWGSTGAVENKIMISTSMWRREEKITKPCIFGSFDSENSARHVDELGRNSSISGDVEFETRKWVGYPAMVCAVVEFLQLCFASLLEPLRQAPWRMRSFCDHTKNLTTYLL